MPSNSGTLSNITQTIRKYTKTERGSVVVSKPSPNTAEVNLEWTQPDRASYDVFVRLLDEPGTEPILAVIVQSRVVVPQRHNRNVAVLMNVLNMNSDYGSFRMNVETGLVSFVASAFYSGCDVDQMTIRFLREAESSLAKLVDICVLSRFNE